MSVITAVKTAIKNWFLILKADIMMPMFLRIPALTLSLLLVAVGPAVRAESGFSMEAMTIVIEGDVSYGPSFEKLKKMKEGDLIPPGYMIVVKDGAYIDIALDPDWENVVRLSGPAAAKIRSIFPTDIHLEYGSIYSRLPNLPAHSTHEIQTPLAVAAVRGSEYLVTHNTQTEVFNFSASPVFVFGTSEFGDLLGSPLLLRDNHTTGILGLGQKPLDQQVMSADQLKSGLNLRNSMITNSEQARLSKTPKTQDLTTVQTQYTQALKERLNKKLEASGKKKNLTPADYSKLLNTDRNLNTDISDLVNDRFKGGTTVGGASGTATGGSGQASSGTSAPDPQSSGLGTIGRTSIGDSTAGTGIGNTISSGTGTTIGSTTVGSTAGSSVGTSSTITSSLGSSGAGTSVNGSGGATITSSSGNSGASNGSSTTVGTSTSGLNQSGL